MIAAAVALAFVAWFTWQGESERVEKANAVEQLTTAVSGETFEEEEPQRGGSVAAGGLAAVLFLGGVILIAASPPPSDDEDG
jgi:hypothetical protein